MINEEPSTDGCVVAALWLFLLAIVSSNKSKLSRLGACNNSNNNKTSSYGKYSRADLAVVLQKSCDSRRRIGEDEGGWELDGIMCRPDYSLSSYFHNDEPCSIERARDTVLGITRTSCTRDRIIVVPQSSCESFIYCELLQNPPRPSSSSSSCNPHDSSPIITYKCAYLGSKSPTPR